MKNAVVATCLLILLLGLALRLRSGQACATGEEAGPGARFPFVIPWDDDAKTVTDVSALNPAPLDGSRRVVIRDGHFFDGTGRRVRFVGTDLAAGACFPRKEDAPRIAARMHKYGINCVRMHHMDSEWAQPNMFYLSGGSYGKKTDQLDPQSLDRFDYLIYQFKQHGIYIDLNLHVGRAFTQLDGLPDTDKLPEMGKVVGYFEPRMIARQKLYAEQLLTHLNPYTKTRYAEEPTIAVIELTNEDSLLDAADSLPSLPPHYRDLLTQGWNQLLKTEYGSTAKLLKAWNAEAVPLGENLLRNPRFEQGTEGWNLEQHEAARAEMSVEAIPAAPEAPPGRALRLGKLQPDKTAWHLQFTQPGLDLKEGQRYTLSFAARADAERSLGVGVMLDQDPWRGVGLSSGVALTPRWQRYSYVFVATGTVPRHVRLNFGFGAESPDFKLADLSLRPGGGAVELAPGESLEAGSIALPSLSASPRGGEYAAYLMKVESDFSQGLRDYIHHMLASKAPVACSQASYGGLGGVWREAHMDWVDMHAYWQHPWFPNRPWDPNDYRIGNTPMVRDENGGTLTELAMHRVAGKPFTVSEYDHPAPSEWAAEAVPMIFAYAAWQDWDGVFLFAYDEANTGWDRDHIDSFFDQQSHPGKFAFLPAAAEMFLRGEVGPAPTELRLVVPEARVPAVVAQHTEYSFWSAATKGRKVSRPDMVAARTAVRFVGPQAESLRHSAVAVGETGDVLTFPATSKLIWTPERGQFRVDAPAAKVVVGFLGGKSADLTGLRVSVQPSTRNFVSLTLTSMDGRPTGQSGSLLLTAVDKVENTGLEWNADRNFAAHPWERGPTLAEVPTATVILDTKARRATVHALGNTGKRVKEVPSKLSSGRLTFTIGPEYRALWYEVEASGAG